MIARGLICSVLAFLLTALFVPLIIRFCHRRQIFDRPGPLKIHQHPVPRLGGVAIVVAIAITAVMCAGSARTGPVFAALALVWFASLIDDIRSLSAAIRLVVQIAAGVLLWLAGWGAPFPSGPAATLLSLFATCFLVATFVNALNFLDGSDGLAAGVSSILATAYALLFWSRADSFGLLFASATVGACLGFLIYNFPPRAKIFLGDSGSAALGFLMAFFALESWRAQPLTTPKLLFPFLVAALPLMDAGAAVIRRIVSGASPLCGDRRHIYDLQLDRKWSAREVAAFCYIVTAAFSGIAFWGALRESAHFAIVASTGVIFLAVYMLWLGSLRSRRESRSPERFARSLKQREAGFD